MNTLDKPNNKALLKLIGIVAGPIAVQSLIGSSLNLVDNLMIGGLGELALNAVGVSVQIFFVFWMFIYGFSGGCATFVAQFYGVKDYLNIKRVTGFGISVCLGMGVLFFVAAEFFPEYVLRVFTRFPEVIETGVPYLRVGAPCFLINAVSQSLTMALRATQQTTVPLKASVTALCANTVLNYMLIYGKFFMPALGVMGAALATDISRIIELAIIMVYVTRRTNILRGSLADYIGYNKNLAFRIVRNALPTTLNETLWGLGTSMYIAAFARISISAGAAVQACNTINNMFSLAAFSIGDAILIIVGQKLGEGDKELAYYISKYMIKVGLVIGLLMGGITILFGKPILGLFDFTEEGANDAWMILVVYAATLWLEVYNSMLVTGALRAGGDTRFAMLTEGGTVWLIGVPIAFFTSLVLHWPIFLAVLGVKVEGVVKAAILTLRFRSKKWLNNVIDELHNRDT